MCAIRMCASTYRTRPLIAVVRVETLCRVTIINQVLVDREGSSYYYLLFTPLFTPTIAISDPVLYVDGILLKNASLPLYFDRI